LPRPIIKAHPEVKWAWPWAKEVPKNLGFPSNISATAEGRDFKFDLQLRFAKAHHKITRRRKRGRGLGLGELPKILGFSYNISAMAGASDFKFGKQLGFAKANNKITRRRKGGVALGYGSSPKFGVPLQYLHNG